MSNQGDSKQYFWKNNELQKYTYRNKWRIIGEREKFRK